MTRYSNTLDGPVDTLYMGGDFVICEECRDKVPTEHSHLIGNRLIGECCADYCCAICGESRTLYKGEKYCEECKTECIDLIDSLSTDIDDDEDLYHG